MFTNHIIIFHWDEFAELIVNQLLNADKQVVVLSADEGTRRVINDNYKDTVVKAHRVDYQDFMQLREVGIAESDAVLLNFPVDTDKLRYLIHLRKAFPDVRYVVSIANPDLKETFYNSGVHYCISREEISAKMVSSYLFERDVAHYSSDLLSASDTKTEQDMQQFKVISGNPLVQKSYSEAFYWLEGHYNALLAGLSRNRTLMKLPDPSTVIQEGDYLIVLVDGVSGDTLSKDFGVPEGLLRD